MDDAERVTAFLESYAARLDAWVEALASARVAPAGAAGRSPEDPDTPDPLSRILRELLEGFSTHSTGDSASLRRLSDLHAAGGIRPRQLVDATLSPDPDALERFAVESGIPLPVCHVLGPLLARAVLRAAGPAAAGDREPASPLHCPLCGRPAALAFLMPGGGGRTLWCGLCGSTWTASRLGCPACGNEDRGSLGYFTLDGAPGRRVDFCRRCGGYLKTIDLRAAGASLNPARADFEHLSSADLDHAAMREGFAPMGRGGPRAVRSSPSTEEVLS